LSTWSGGSGGRWSSAARAASECSLTTHQRNVLLSIQHVRNRRSHPAALTRLDIEELFTFVGRVCDKSAIGNNLENQIPSSR
jgi:hypothetical protein